MRYCDMRGVTFEKSLSGFDLEILRDISGLKMCDISIWVAGGLLLTNPEKKISGSSLNNLTGYLVYVMLQIFTFSHDVCLFVFL